MLGSILLIFILAFNLNATAMMSKPELSVYCLGTQSSDELKIFSFGSDFKWFELNGEKWNIGQVIWLGDTEMAYIALNKRKQFRFVFKTDMYFTTKLELERSSPEMRCKFVGKINSVQEPLCSE